MKDIVKEKVFIFAIGILLGAVIATGAFMVCTKTCHKGGKGEIVQLPNGNQPAMNNGQNGNNQPPSMPDGNSNQNNQNSQNGQPPEMPNNDNSQSDSNTQTNNN